MSLFIGKDNNNNNIVHITNRETNILDMKSTSPLVNTVFDTRLPLTSYRLIPLTYSYYRPYNRIMGWDPAFTHTLVCTCFVGPEKNYEDSTTFPYGYIPVVGFKAYSMDSNDYSFLISSLGSIPGRILFLDSNYRALSSVGIANIVSLTSYTSTYGQKYSSTLSTSYTFGLADFQYVNSPTVSYILVILDNYYVPTSGEVKINNTGMYINNIDIFYNKKLITPVANVYSTKVTDEIYLTQTPTSSGSGLSLTTNGGTSIKVNNIELFNSTTYSYLPVKPSTVSSISLSVPYSISWVDTLLYVLKPHESYCRIKASLNTHRLIDTYAFVTRSSNNPTVLGVVQGSSSPIRIDFTLVFCLGGNVYIRSTRAGGGGATVNKNLVFEISAF